jgi:hypothetical protein
MGGGSFFTWSLFYFFGMEESAWIVMLDLQASCLVSCICMLAAAGGLGGTSSLFSEQQHHYCG